MRVFGNREERKREAQAALDSAVPRRRGPDLSTVIMLLVMVAGMMIIAYPTFSDWWNSFHQARAIAAYNMVVEKTDQATIDAMIEKARDYNERLTGNSSRYVPTDTELAEYESLLNLTGDGVIGYIQIASIGVNLPIYHGVGEDILQKAIGHIIGTSLPVGGPTTHCAVSGHRGLPSAKLFTDIDQLVEGDIFTVTVLNQTITYQVDQIRIVEPNDMSDLNFTTDADFVTLVTCTPYGVNTHRLLVRGHRIENLADIVTIPPEAVQIPNYIAVPAVGIPMLFVYLVCSLIYYRWENRSYDRQKVLEELKALEEARGTEAARAPLGQRDATASDEPAANTNDTDDE